MSRKQRTTVGPEGNQRVRDRVALNVLPRRNGEVLFRGEVLEPGVGGGVALSVVGRAAADASGPLAHTHLKNESHWPLPP